MENTWWWSLYGEWFDHGPFDTKEEAIKDGRKYLKSYNNVRTSFFVAQTHERSEITLEVDIEQMLENAFENAELAHADDYRCETAKDRALLQERVQKVYDEWAKETNNEINVYTMCEPEEFKIHEED